MVFTYRIEPSQIFYAEKLEKCVLIYIEELSKDFHEEERFQRTIYVKELSYVIQERSLWRRVFSYMKEHKSVKQLLAFEGHFNLEGLSQVCLNFSTFVHNNNQRFVTNKIYQW